ncbi:MAG: efflux RND transporter periplasmic adaptor subunit [Pseudomonadales bacterium]|nr:efflux RND transporter periplasmic adaptor subunit [Pseudomonadales bacterium]
MKKWLISIAIIAFAFSGAFVMVQTRAAPTQMEREIPVLLVDAIEARRGPVIFRINTQGAVTPRTESILVSEVSGQIVEVASNYVSGGFFRQGELLLKIDPRNYQSALKSAQANVARVQTQVAKENALANFALDDWKTLQDLNASTGPISDLALRKPQLAEAIAELTSAEAALEKAQEDLNRTSIRAPYDGMVQEKRADVGQYVNTGSQLALIFATDYAEIRLPITQRELALVDLPSVGDSSSSLPVSLTSQAGTVHHTWEGLIVRSEGIFDSASRVLYAVAQVEDPYNQNGRIGEPLRIGTFVTASIQGRFGGALFTVPRHALQRGETLWVIDEQQKIYPRDVEVVSTDEEYAYVDAGLTDGERYTITPVDQPLPGMPVRVNSSLPMLGNVR